MGKNNVFIQKYMKWTVKSPVTVLTIIFIGFGCLLYLVSTTDINVYKTYEGVVAQDEEGRLYIKADIDTKIIHQPMHWYIDRQQAVYQTVEYGVESYGDGYRVKAMVLNNSDLSLEPGQTVYIDIPKERITVLSRIVSRGRKDE